MRYRDQKSGREQTVRAVEIARQKILETIPYIDRELSQALNKAGFWTYEALRQATDAELLAIPGIGAGRLRAIRKFTPGR